MNDNQVPKADRDRPLVHERLYARRGEIEEAILSRSFSLSDPTEVENAEYLAGLRDAVGTAIDYALAITGGSPPGPIPAALLTQARSAARVGISLDVVLRRYIAGYTLLSEFIMQEAEKVGPPGSEEAHRISKTQAAVLDHLVAAVTEEYTSEIEDRHRSVEQLKTERVTRLLAGELVDDAKLGYSLGSRWHLGAVATGPGVLQAFRDLAGRLDRQLLLVRPGDGTAWAWLGGSVRIEADAVCSVSSEWPEEVTLAIGEPAHGLSGWRLTHRQAAAARTIATRSNEKLVRYRDVALLAAALRDEVLSSSLDRIYLSPLAHGYDDGATLRHTLRAYFDAGRNVSAAAAALGVSRKTIRERLCAIEEKIGLQLKDYAAEMETALRLQRFFDGRVY